MLSPITRLNDVQGDPRQGEDEHQQADHGRLCRQHIHRHSSHIQPDTADQTQVILSRASLTVRIS